MKVLNGYQIAAMCLVVEMILSCNLDLLAYMSYAYITVVNRKFCNMLLLMFLTSLWCIKISFVGMLFFSFVSFE